MVWNGRKLEYYMDTKVKATIWLWKIYTWSLYFPGVLLFFWRVQILVWKISKSFVTFRKSAERYPTKPNKKSIDASILACKEIHCLKNAGLRKILSQLNRKTRIFQNHKSDPPPPPKKTSWCLTSSPLSPLFPLVLRFTSKQFKKQNIFWVKAPSAYVLPFSIPFMQ